MTTEQLIIRIKDVNQEIEYYEKVLNDAPSPKKFYENPTFVELLFSGEVIKVQISHDMVISVLYSKLKELRSELNHHEQMLLKSLK